MIVTVLSPVFLILKILNINKKKVNKRDFLKAISIAIILIGGLILIYLITMHLWVRIGYPE